MTRTKQDDSSHFLPRDDEGLPTWLESAPDWRQYTRDEIQHERMIYDQ
jgi:hypothetical protein